MSTATYFDTRFQTMNKTIGTDGCWDVCYEQQVALLESVIQPGATILDVGCGPVLPYRADHSYVIGLDPSQASLDANTDVDERIRGSATAIPLPDASVDVVVALYAIHHLTGENVFDHDAARLLAFQEMYRVVRPGGQILVFDLSPWILAGIAQDLLWTTAKAWLGDKLDAYFWSTEIYRSAISERPCEVTTFGGSPFTWLPPILSLPWFKIPRFLYPLTPSLYRWQKELPRGR